MVAHGAAAVAMPPGDLAEASSQAAAPSVVPRHWAWAGLMRRAFDIDVLACPRCGGRLRLIATVEEPGAIRAILTSLGLAAEPPARASPSIAETTAT